MEGMDPAKKQYLILSAVVSVLLSFVWNFLGVNMMKDSYGYGVPIGLSGHEGFSGFIIRLIDTGLMAILIVVPVYLCLLWLRDRGGRG